MAKNNEKIVSEKRSFRFKGEYADRALALTRMNDEITNATQLGYTVTEVFYHKASVGDTTMVTVAASKMEA